MSSNLILPGSFEFEETLAMSLPTGWQQSAYGNHGEYGFVVDSSSGLLRTANFTEMEEYLEGGEYDERLLQIGNDDNGVE